MTDEKEIQNEEYLRKNGWMKYDDNLWQDYIVSYPCCLEVALLVQKYRDKNKTPWYKRIFNYIRGING
ncbi:MAG TPA: hypothetical protein VN704_04830 [Verrucomicrobiae bacterium]|nr:hypothetical protein [Verrucomicrobiae bacterium]